VDMTAQVQQSLLEGQVRLVETVADRRRAALHLWTEAGGPAADGARAAVHTAALVEEGTAERLLEGTVDQVKAAIRPIDDPVRLDALERAERAERGRKGVLEAIQIQRETLAEPNGSSS
jgi:hypothetical protein